MSNIKIVKSLDADGVINKLKAGIELHGSASAKKIEGSAKSNAPWKDRTSNARNSIQGNFKWENKKALIELSGNVDYFIYLELAHEKKNAILIPTIQKEGPDILKGYKEIFR